MEEKQKTPDTNKTDTGKTDNSKKHATILAVIGIILVIAGILIVSVHGNLYGVRVWAQFRSSWVLCC